MMAISVRPIVPLVWTAYSVQHWRVVRAAKPVFGDFCAGKPKIASNTLLGHPLPKPFEAARNRKQPSAPTRQSTQLHFRSIPERISGKLQKFAPIRSNLEQFAAIGAHQGADVAPMSRRCRADVASPSPRLLNLLFDAIAANCWDFLQFPGNPFGQKFSDSIAPWTASFRLSLQQWKNH